MMFGFSTTAALLALAASAAAYQVTSPTNGEVWDAKKPQIVSWTRVDTDPQTFAITLVHQASEPNIRIFLKENVNGGQGQGSTIVNPPDRGWPTGSAYQINLVQDREHLDSILAQSPQFNIRYSPRFTDSAPQSPSIGSSA